MFLYNYNCDLLMYYNYDFVKLLPKANHLQFSPLTPTVPY